MAGNKKLKKAARARMKETGESYTVARAAVFTERERLLSERDRLFRELMTLSPVQKVHG